MTLPRPDTLERETGKLYVTDAEMYRWLGVPDKIMRRILPELEAKHAFPRPSPLFGNRRYRPAIKAWLDRHHGIFPQERKV